MKSNHGRRSSEQMVAPLSVFASVGAQLYLLPGGSVRQTASAATRGEVGAEDQERSPGSVSPLHYEATVARRRAERGQVSFRRTEIVL
jgi:hypothetical protein